VIDPDTLLQGGIVLGFGSLLLVAWPLLAASLGTRLARGISPRLRHTGGAIALAVFGFGFFSSISFPGWAIDALAVAAASLAFWLWAAAARPVLRWMTVGAWLTVLLATLFDVVPWLHWQESHRGWPNDWPFATAALRCGRVAEMRHDGMAFTAPMTTVTIVSHPLGGLLEHEWGHRVFYDGEEIGFDGLEFVAADNGACATEARSGGALVWRID